MGLELGGGDRLLFAGVADDDATETLAQFREVLREAENCHHFGRDGDVEAGLTADPVGHAAHADDDFAQGPVVHVHDAPPHDAVRIEAESVAVIEVVVQDRGQEIVGGGDGVKITGEMEVDVLHRHDLGITAAGGATLHAEARPEGRLAQTDAGALADAVQRIAETDGSRGLPFPGGRRRDGGDKHEPALGLGQLFLIEIEADLGLVFSVMLERGGGNIEPCGDFFNRQHGRLLGNFDV